jgi:hypothetical protein
MDSIVLLMLATLVSFLLGYFVAKATTKAPSIRELNQENTCRMYEQCVSLVNPACISGHCNMHCRTYCQCGASEDPPKKEIWADVILDEDN